MHRKSERVKELCQNEVVNLTRRVLNSEPGVLAFPEPVLPTWSMNQRPQLTM
jgi:hypothetical protein